MTTPQTVLPHPRRRWFLSGVFVLLPLLLMAGCAQKGGGPGQGGGALSGSAAVTGGQRTPGGVLDDIITRGEMRVGYLVWAPAVIKDAQTGQLSGIYPELVDWMASQLKVKVNWQETNLASFQAGLASRQFDFCVGPSFVTVPRAVGAAFTQPILYVGNSGVVKKESALTPQTIGELNRPGVKVAVLQGQAMEEYATRFLPKAEIMLIPGGDLTAPLLAVSSGQADVGLSNNVTVARYLEAHAELKGLFMGPEQIEFLPIAWSTRHDEPALLNFLNSAIAVAKSTGRLEALQKKHKLQLLNDVPALHPPR